MRDGLLRTECRASILFCVHTVTSCIKRKDSKVHKFFFASVNLSFCLHMLPSRHKVGVIMIPKLLLHLVSPTHWSLVQQFTHTHTQTSRQISSLYTLLI